MGRHDGQEDGHPRFIAKIVLHNTNSERRRWAASVPMVSGAAEVSSLVKLHGPVPVQQF